MGRKGTDTEMNVEEKKRETLDGERQGIYTLWQAVPGSHL